jgi:hypothetical protein
LIIDRKEPLCRQFPSSMLVSKLVEKIAAILKEDGARIRLIAHGKELIKSKTLVF